MFRFPSVLILPTLVLHVMAWTTVYGQSNRFSYDGDALVRGFYLSRDLPLQRVQRDPCPAYGAGSTAVASSDPALTSPASATSCNEKQDYYTTRLRLNMNFAPNLYTDVYYGIQVGEFIFGRDPSSGVGPVSGGLGSGAVNVQTRELRLRLHDEAKTTYFDAGVFPVGSPAGLVIATSGAGFRLEGEIKGLYSSYQLVYLRQVDSSIRDGDANGYNDRTFKNVNLLYGSWKYYGFQNVNAETFVVYRRDPEEYDDSGKAKDISQLYWIGNEERFTRGAFSFMVLGAVNLGVISSTQRVDLSGSDNLLRFASSTSQLQTIDAPTLRRSATPWSAEYQDLLKQGDAAYPGSRNRYPVQSGAGLFEVAYRVLEGSTLAIGGATGSGRLGPEPDGRTSDYRKDRFRTANGAFQYTDIAVDVSGGYSIFKGGSISGLRIWDIQWRQKLSTTLEGKLTYFRLVSCHGQDGTYNQFYGWWKGRASSYIGDEVNWMTEWRPFNQFILTVRAAIFLPGRGYRFLMDGEHGSAAREFSLSLLQRF